MEQQLLPIELSCDYCGESWKVEEFIFPTVITRCRVYTEKICPACENLGVLDTIGDEYGKGAYIFSA